MAKAQKTEAVNSRRKRQRLHFPFSSRPNFCGCLGWKGNRRRRRLSWKVFAICPRRRPVSLALPPPFTRQKSPIPSRLRNKGGTIQSNKWLKHFNPSLPPSFHLDKEEEAPISCREEEEEEGMERDGEKSLVITNSSFSRTFQLLLLLSLSPKWNIEEGKGGIFYFP